MIQPESFTALDHQCSARHSRHACPLCRPGRATVPRLMPLASVQFCAMQRRAPGQSPAPAGSETHRPTPQCSPSPPLPATQSENQGHDIRRKRMIDEFHRGQGKTNTPHEVRAGKIEPLPTPFSFRRPRAAQTVYEQRSNSKTRLTPPHRTACKHSKNRIPQDCSDSALSPHHLPTNLSQESLSLHCGRACAAS